MKTELKNFIPENSYPLVLELLKKYPFTLKITRERNTKHGDFRYQKNGFIITVNNNLNQFQFLITLIHEIAHLVTYSEYKNIKPHGKEWKQNFKLLMLPFLTPNIFPDDILPILAKHLKNPKASSDTDVNLALALKKYSPKSDKNYIFEIENDKYFIYNERIFKQGQKRRTRYECTEVKTGKKYLFNQNVEVKNYP